MPIITLSDSTRYVNITALSSVSGSLVLTNLSSYPLYYIVNSTQPSATAQGSTIVGEADERGVPGGSTGYYKITNTGAQTVTGVFKLWWEERP